ncbi:MAG: hypothetical protein ACI4O9_05170, partial [Akkermansia sp.]
TAFGKLIFRRKRLRIAPGGVALYMRVRGVLCALAWFATALALLLSLVSEIGGVDVHAGDSAAEGGDTGVCSLRAIISFFLGFGWSGFVVAQAGAVQGLRFDKVGHGRRLGERQRGPFCAEPGDGNPAAA